MDNLDVPESDDESAGPGSINDSSDRELAEKGNINTDKRNKESDDLGAKALKTDRTAT